MLRRNTEKESTVEIARPISTFNQMNPKECKATAGSMEEATLRYRHPGPMPSTQMPSEWTMDKMESFDPKIHLQVEKPEFVKDMNFKDVAYPYSPEERGKFGGLAYTQPFRCLSKEGVAAARRAVDNARATYSEASVDPHAVVGKGNSRATHFARGVGYTSKFMRDFTYDQSMTDLLSDIARDELWPHTMTMSVGHTNVGAIATGKPVDKWHVDSTPYVFIIILSDLEEIEGGLLRVLQQPDSSGKHFNELLIKGIPPELVESVRYTGAGYGIFMQGSKILHAVTPVLKAREPRYSLVNSYMSTRVFNYDGTKLHTFLDNGFDDRKDVTLVEFARHKAWRMKGQMSYLLDEAPFGSTPEELAAVFENAGAELLKAASLLLGKEDDAAGHVDDAEKQAEGGGGGGGMGGSEGAPVFAKPLARSRL